MAEKFGESKDHELLGDTLIVKHKDGIITGFINVVYEFEFERHAFINSHDDKVNAIKLFPWRIRNERIILTEYVLNLSKRRSAL